MLWTETASLIILSLTWGAQIFLRSFLVRHHRLIWRVSVIVIFGIASLWAYLQYDVWRSNDLTELFLLDPFYFFQYVGYRIYAPWFVSLIFALLVGHSALWLNRRFGERFFETEEVPLLALGTFLAGYPTFLLYFILLFLGGLILTLSYTLRRRGRAPLYYLWLPAAVFAILIKNWYLPEALLNLFTFGRTV